MLKFFLYFLQCWYAASLLKCKVDRRESLVLAEKGLNCECNEELVALMYRKLRTLKEKIPYRAGEISIKGRPVSVEDIRLSWQETSTNLENDHIFQNEEMDLHGEFSHGACQETSAVAEQIISERQEPVQETCRECHTQNHEILSMIVEKSIDLVRNVFSLREKNILCKQQLEISGLVTHRQNNVIRLKKVCSLVLEYIHRSHIDEMTRSKKINLTTQWFTMLMYAYLEHMKLQHDKLEGLQSDTWSSERQLKEKLNQVAKSGQLDRYFDRYIALPDSNFVMEEFIHFKEQNDEHRIAESSVSCQHSSNDALAMEFTLVRNEVLSEPTSIQAMENEPVETSVGSGRGPASEAADFPENSIRCSSDGIGVQRAGCSSSSIPTNDDSTGQVLCCSFSKRVMLVVCGYACISFFVLDLHMRTLFYLCFNPDFPIELTWSCYISHHWAIHVINTHDTPPRWGYRRSVRGSNLWFAQKGLWNFSQLPLVCFHFISRQVCQAYHCLGRETTFRLSK
jgi:chromodomain-helicase-DNA-binding protein 4